MLASTQLPQMHGYMTEKTQKTLLWFARNQISFWQKKHGASISSSIIYLYLRF